MLTDWTTVVQAVASVVQAAKAVVLVVVTAVLVRVTTVYADAAKRQAEAARYVLDGVAPLDVAPDRARRNAGLLDARLAEPCIRPQGDP